MIRATLAKDAQHIVKTAVFGKWLITHCKNVTCARPQTAVFGSIGQCATRHDHVRPCATRLRDPCKFIWIPKPMLEKL